MPEVSVIIPAFNAGRTIDAALDSVFAQTFADIDVIVVDGGSNGDTAARLATYGSAVSCARQSHRNVSSALNAGLLMARSPLVAFLDPTSTWLPRKLERQLGYFAAHPTTGFVHGTSVDSATPTEMLASIDSMPAGGVFTPPLAPGAPGFNPDHVVTSSVIVRRSVIDTVGLFDTLVPATEAEREFWARIAAHVPVGSIDVPVVVSRPAGDHAAPPARPATPLNLLHDTGFRRARTTFTSAIHRFDDAIARRTHKPQRILFEAASPMSLAVVAPVLRQLRDDPRLEFFFTSCDRSWTPGSIFGRSPIPGRVVSPEDVRWVKFDGYINTDFWDMTWLPRRTRRVHFFHGVAGKYGLDAPVRIAPVVATFDRLCFPNRDRLRRYAEAGIIDGDSPQAALIGYPKVDCLVDGTLDRSETLASVGAEVTRPTVLYAPTWSPYSSLNTVGRQVIAALARLDVNVIVKLHDRSYDSTARGSGGVDWGRRLRQACERHGAHLVRDADASPWLHAADLLITDHSSVGFEFMLLDRPIVVLDSPDLLTHARVNPDKVTLLRNAAHVVRHIGELGPTVRAALAQPHEHHVQRTRVAQELFYCPGSATGRAVQCIYELLELTQPAALGVEAREGAAMAKLGSLARTG